MNEERWSYIKQFYKDNFDIPGDLVDLVADKDILVMCVSGASNGSISKICEVDIEDVYTVLVKVLDFTGWISDLEFNPLLVYSTIRLDTGKSGLNQYKDFRNTISSDWLDDDVKTMFRICKKYEQISTNLDKNWV